MTLYQIRAYHNTESRFMPYQDGHRLTAAVSHVLDLPADTSPEQIAERAFHVFNADLDQLETGRATPDGEADFLIACVYRLLRLRSLSTGDIVAVTVNGQTTWLSCEFIGWKRIDTPTNLTGQPLTAETVYQHLRRGRHV